MISYRPRGGLNPAAAARSASWTRVWAERGLDQPRRLHRDARSSRSATEHSAASVGSEAPASARLNATSTVFLQVGGWSSIWRLARVMSSLGDELRAASLLSSTVLYEPSATPQHTRTMASHVRSRQGRCM